MALQRDPLAPLDTFERRHTGSADAAVAEMLQTVGHASLDALTDAAVPANIRLKRPLRLPAAASESTALAELHAIAAKNKIFRSFIGLGYYDTVVPGVIHNRQPRFNEGPAMWHLEGATLPLLNPLPGPSHA